MKLSHLTTSYEITAQSHQITETRSLSQFTLPGGPL